MIENIFSTEKFDKNIYPKKKIQQNWKGVENSDTCFDHF